jgi:predicted lipoprotein
MSIDPSRHAGDRSFERNIDATLVNHVIRTGGQTVQPNGHILHIARDPNNIDHRIKVITTPHPKKIVTVIRDTSLPFAEEQASAKADVKAEADAKARVNKSKANRKAQLEKKRARTPKPKNK